MWSDFSSVSAETPGAAVAAVPSIPVPPGRCRSVRAVLTTREAAEMIEEFKAIFFAVLGGILVWVITSENLMRKDR